jgi:hypothetical protein
LAKWWTIFFLIGILGQTFSKSLIVFSFRLNQKAIAATKCINRAKPRSCCKGSCYLTRQLAQDEQSQNTPLNNNAGSKFEVLLYSETKSDAVHLTASFHKLTHTADYTDPVTTQACAAIFHPPQC